MPKFLVETIEIIKKQYVVDANDQIEANDQVTMKEKNFYDKCSLGEIIVRTSHVQYDDDQDECIYVPNADPVKAAKYEVLHGI